jgi:hypothetical protein
LILSQYDGSSHSLTSIPRAVLRVRHHADADDPTHLREFEVADVGELDALGDGLERLGTARPADPVRTPDEDTTVISLGTRR